jgi:hypothetical protein
MFGAATRRFDIEVQGTHHEVLLARRHAGGMLLTVGEASRWPWRSPAPAWNSTRWCWAKAWPSGASS